MYVNQIGEEYHCNVCGNTVEIKKLGGGQLICCHQPMIKVEEEQE